MEGRLVVKILLCMVLSGLNNAASGAKRVHIVHWTKSNPMFRIDNTDNVIDVNVDNLRWEYDQANFVCPVTKSGSDESETYIIYNVSKEEYDSCMVTKPSSRIVASCTDPSQLLYFTITFRSFTPTPGGLEFHPGKDYYFISTSTPEDLHRREGGKCATHNMKVMFKVANISAPSVTTSTTTNSPNTADTDRIQTLHKSNHAFVNKPRTTTTIRSTLKPQVLLDDKHKYYPVLNEGSDIDANTLESAKKVVRDFQNYRRRSYSHEDNEVIKQEASRMHSAASASVSASGTVLLLLFINMLLSR